MKTTNRTPIRLLPLALLLTVISICLTVLAILTFSTAGADLRLAEKYAETVRTRYELEIEGQEFLQANAARAADTETETTLYRGQSELHILLGPDGADGFSILEWRHERQWTEDTDIGNLWDGH
jgi:hypothetical protein